MKSKAAFTASLLFLISRQKNCVHSLSHLLTSSGVKAKLLPLHDDARYNRRECFGIIYGATLSAACAVHPALATADDEPMPESRAITNFRLKSPQVRAGVELTDERIGTPPRNVVAVRSVRLDGAALKYGVQPGMILKDFPDARSVVERIKNGPYPIDLRFFNLAAGGDAIGMEGRPIVSAEDALRTAKKASGDEFGNVAAPQVADAMSGTASGFATRVARKAEGKCGIQSRRGDVLEIRYEARVGNQQGRIYDSSDWRGTGQPYAYNLGNGDVIRGVDLGTYDMCPGEVRELSIPPELGYGQRGSKLFDIPGNSRLWWQVELVALNFIREGENENLRNKLYDGGSGTLPVYQ
mmetsp:Transcript_36558/g.109873  ORF Transcript_36558/g.109873 Transcript_36558/m.109873 type:complete len:353 (-) Transcript_36558:197-1255(-)